MKARFFRSIEMLEDRIAPAALAGQVLSYTDRDGDKVSITISKGMLSQSNFTFSDPTGAAIANPFAVPIATPMQLQAMDIHGDAGVSGANITVKVTKAAFGDGLAAIGAIDATGVDLGTVTIAGDLGMITAGSNGPSNVAIKALTIHSLGTYGEATQSSSPSLTSTIKGHLGNLSIAADLASGATLAVSDSSASANSGIGAITIGGSLLGSLSSAGGGLGLLTVKGSILGGTVTEASGAIAGIKVTGSIAIKAGVTDSAGNIGPVTIGGSLFDAATIQSTAGSIGIIKVTGSIYNQSTIKSSGNIGAITVGATVSNALIQIAGTGALTSVSIGGNLADGATIETNSGKLGNVTVKGSIEDQAAIGTTSGDMGSVTVTRDLIDSALISSGGSLGAVSFGGAVTGNIGAVNGITSLSIHGDFSGQIAASVGSIGAVTIGGDLAGGTISSGGTLGAVKITGQFYDGGIGTVGSITSITVGKSVIGSQILAGTANPSINAVNIGAVKVGGDWIGSNLSAGVKGTSGDYGLSTDTQEAGSSKITSIAITGLIEGSAGSMHHFGFDAGSIGSFIYSKIKEQVSFATPHTIDLMLVTADVAIELV